MAELEDLGPGVKVKGIAPQQEVSVVDVKWHGTAAVELVYKCPDGQPATQLLFRSDEPHSATAALTKAELPAEIGRLRELERAAHELRRAGVDRKWEELATIIQDSELMYDGQGQRTRTSRPSN